MLLRRVARPLLAGIFITGGIAQLRDPEGHAKAAHPVLDQVAGLVPVQQPPSNLTLVRVDAGVKVGAGVLLALGKAPRLAATALAATLVPTTLAGHRFWEEEDPELRAQQQIHFVKNLGLLGGLMLAAADTEGKPSLAWRARHAGRTSAATAELLHRDITEGLSTLTGQAGAAVERAGAVVDRAGSRAGEVAGRAGSRAGEVAGRAGARAGEVAELVGSRASSLAEVAGDRAATVADRAGTVADLAGERLGDQAARLLDEAQRWRDRAEKRAARLAKRARKAGERASKRATKQIERASKRADRRIQRATKRAEALRAELPKRAEHLRAELPRRAEALRAAVS